MIVENNIIFLKFRTLAQYIKRLAYKNLIFFILLKKKKKKDEYPYI